MLKEARKLSNVIALKPREEPAPDAPPSPEETTEPEFWAIDLRPVLGDDTHYLIQLTWPVGRTAPLLEAIKQIAPVRS